MVPMTTVCIGSRIRYRDMTGSLPARRAATARSGCSATEERVSSSKTGHLPATVQVAMSVGPRIGPTTAATPQLAT